MSFIKQLKQLTLPINYDEADRFTRRQAREQYITEQKGICCHCNLPLTQLPVELIKKYPINKSLFPKSMFDYPIHLHHCHGTGMTIGAVHAHCNAILWQYHGE